MTEMLNNLDVMLAKLRDCALTENSRQQTVPKLLRAAKSLIEAAEQISTTEFCPCDGGIAIQLEANVRKFDENPNRRFQEAHVNPSYYQELSKKLYQIRRSRDRVFNEDELFADPGWDILLDLTDAELTNRSVSVTSACIAACVPPTTGLRWVSLLESRDYIERTPDGLDGRRRFLRLTDKARRLMNRFYIDLAHRQLT